MVDEPSTTSQTSAMRWTPRLIRHLRGTRTQAEFGALLGARKNTIWRWEAGQARPDARYRARLCELAGRERFLDDWQLVGSMTLIGDLDSAQAKMTDLFRSSLEHTSRLLTE
jgi:transcriptional regulator with XRE-family HTH domain